MIVSFGDRDTRRLFFGERVPAFQSFAQQALSRLRDLDNTNALMDLTRRRGNRWRPCPETGMGSIASVLTAAAHLLSLGG